MSLQAVSWEEVRFVSIEELKVRVLLKSQTLEFDYLSRDEMEEALRGWFAPHRKSEKSSDLSAAQP